MSHNNQDYQDKLQQENEELDMKFQEETKEEDPDALREEMKDHDEDRHDADLESGTLPDYTQRD